MIALTVIGYILGVFLIAVGSINDDGDTLMIGIWVHIFATVIVTLRMMVGGLL